jgi:hypothetical protein
VVVSPPTITGSAVQGQTLTGGHSFWLNARPENQGALEPRRAAGRTQPRRPPLSDGHLLPSERRRDLDHGHLAGTIPPVTTAGRIGPERYCGR